MFESEKSIARQNLKIAPDNKILLSIDGGGMRGIFTLQLLKKLEEVAGSPLYKWIDCVAGTSTGGIIAGLIAFQKSATEIEDLYTRLVSQVFTKRGFLANRFYNPPAFDKKNYRALLKSIVGDITLESLTAKSGIDLVFTSKDLAAGEETFFTCFDVSGENKSTYKTVLLRAVLEATMSAPTYFAPLERFIDGGTTTFNNPVGAAVMETCYYDGAGKYTGDKLTVLSFGTATLFRFVDPKIAHNPDGLDVKFWLDYVMDESSKDAGEMQVDVMRSKLIPNVDFRRFQVSLDTEAIGQLPDLPITHIPHVTASSLHGLTDDDLGSIDMADVTKFSLMKAIGEATAEFICPPGGGGNRFSTDLLAPHSRRGALVTAFGDITTIAKNMSDPAWLDSQPTA